MDASTARERADAFRDEQERNSIGEELFKSVAEQLQDPCTSLEVQTQLFRILGNACIDHDVNRDHAIKAEVPRITLPLVAASLSQPKTHESLILLRAAAGCLLNLTMDHTGAQTAFIKAGGLNIILSALDTSSPCPLYTINATATNDNSNNENDQIAALTQLWFLRILEELHQSNSHAEAFSDCGLSLIPLVSFIISSQSYFTHSGAASTPQDLLENESNSLLLAASLFEGLSMDIDALAITVSQSSSTLLQLCDFVESDKTPQTWKSSETLKKNWSMVKSATAKGLIAAASMDDVMMHCLDKNRSAWIIDRCLDWLAREDRPDLCMCSSVILANLARSDQNCLAFVQDFQLVPVLFKTLQRGMEINSTPTKQGEAMQILHGVLSLLKHLSIPAANKLIIGAAGPFEACVKTLEESYDVAQPIQVASIGLIKHLVTSSAPNAASLLAVDSALHNILSLSKRTDDVRLKSESTRVVVQLIRALWTSTDQAHQKVRQQLNSPDVVLALGGMVKSSSKWPILINEGLFSLALLATAHEGVVDYSPLIHDDDFIKSFNNLLSPSVPAPGKLALANGSSNGDLKKQRQPADVQSATRSNALALLKVLLASAKGSDRDRLSSHVKEPLECLQ